MIEGINRKHLLLPAFSLPEGLMKFCLWVLSLAAALAVSAVSVAAALYTQDFNVDDTANWTVLPPTGATDPDSVVDCSHDYSALGVPAPPNGTGTRGLQMNLNNSS